MKKLILSLIGVAMMSVTSWAQVGTSAYTAQNFATVTGNGYGFEFESDSVANCFGSNGVRYYAQDNALRWSMVTGSGKLTITVPTQSVYDGNAQQAHFYTGNCVSTAIDVSTAANQKVRVKLTASGACQVLVIIYAASSSTFGDPGLNMITFNAAGSKDTTMTFPVTGGLAGHLTAVSGVGLLVRGKTGYGDLSFAGTVTFDAIEVGDAINATPPGGGGGTTAVTEAVNNSLIAVYPNPAKDQISVDLSSLNTSDASVKIMNANGFVVYEAKATTSVESINTSSFNKGIYMVQVSSGNKVSNKKIVIE